MEPLREIIDYFLIISFGSSVLSGLFHGVSFYLKMSSLGLQRSGAERWKNAKLASAFALSSFAYTLATIMIVALISYPVFRNVIK